MINLSPDQVEDVVRWYILAGRVQVLTPDRLAAPGGGGHGEGWSDHTTVGLILARCPYKVDGFAPVYLSIRAELRYEAASREFMLLGIMDFGGAVSFVREAGEVITMLERARRTMDRWDREIEYMRGCAHWGPCLAWLGAELALAGRNDPSFMARVVGD